MPKFTPISVHDLGEYLREQRQSAQLSLRQLSEAAGISNPYISQIERGLKKPSAEILQSLAKALRISAESLYVRAGILDERTDLGEAPVFDVTDAILADPKLNDRQRAVLLDVYESFVGDPAAPKAQKVSKPTVSANPKEPGEPGRASSTEHKPSPARRPSPSPLTPEQKRSPSRKSSPAPTSGSARKSSSASLTPEQKQTQQSSTKEKKS
jgi:transcriptional regulator with XRE-family HTH domain